MDDEFKKIKFRNGSGIYTAHAVNLTGRNNQVNGNFLVWIAAFRIYDENDKELVGKICFQQSMLLDYLWADPKSKKFPQEPFLEEALVNLLHYLPFDKDVLTSQSESFIFRFIRDLEDGRQQDSRIHNIKVHDSMEKTFQIKMFGDHMTDELMAKAILEPLYMHRKDSYSTNLHIDLMRSIFPFDKNTIDSNLEILEFNNFIEILRDSTGSYISIKIKPEGVQFLTGISLKSNDKKEMIKKVRYGHNINITTGNNSPVNINADIDTSFDSIRKEIDEKNPENKEEIMKNLGALQDEIKKPHDIEKIKLLLGNIGKAASWVGRRVEPIAQQVIASYISSQLPLTPIK
ncbi:hypothetical protein A3K29_02205 [Candidatus Collierbacteria bacterium RIFOXYB2_FULL_46_14]|nr:MAG: hypothetical protein A3K29_02205 [Candidatus Collierbacteria bacterium RIFOXYB2_FULL_46_14]OGD75980.1 MAG: hypothetical protein A3K43_02205 [Candidatus Collierbacteria bacterium RIFOXYA2_FULL_46_20]OGD77316.1 MAG: hypothetical protein A3K39_02205 [Candidatus Collierbacteria bacterium RIFOXYC2_FULL_43_15]OGD80606.1 MAG: hypothetical protein A2320_02700 [Pseudomonadales bacterium GWC2_63_15]OGD82038.1 MAG: hypothetical protein A3K36_02205 [Candidatus Collierbacteria bacterium RIFOXYD2_FUL